MANFMITTDSNADLPRDYAQMHGIGVMSLLCIMDGVTYSEENPIDNAMFYQKMREGSLPVTAQVTPEEARNVYLKMLETSDQVLHIGFSSALSGSYQSAAFSARELMEEMPDKKIIAVDSLGASLGVSVLVHQAVQMREAGYTLEQTATWLEEHKNHVRTCFTVDDLFHLCRGGRVSKASAIVGSAMGIKPMLEVDAQGQLVSTGKIRGRKRALSALVENMQNQLSTYENATIFISHADAAEDAAFLQQEIETAIGARSFMVNYICPSIGAHAGPGTIALSYLGTAR